MARNTEERREFERYDTDVLATLTCAGMKMAVRMLSVSAGGALVRMDRMSAKVFDAESFLLEIHGIGRFSTSKKWRRDTDLGTKFELSDVDRSKLADRLADRFGRRKSILTHFTASFPNA